MPKTKTEPAKFYARALLDQTREDPVWWMKHALGTDLWSKQAAIAQLLADENYVAIASSNAVGKTYLAGRVVPWFLYAYPDSLVITTSASWISVKHALWPQIRLARQNALLHEIQNSPEPLTTEWWLGVNWGAFGLSTDAPERFASFRTSGRILIIVEEASALEDEIYQAILGLAAAEGTKIFMIGNPLRAEGPFYDAFRSPLWHTMRISALETPNVVSGKNLYPGLATRQWIEDRKDDWGEKSDIYRARVLGQFPTGGGLTPITLTMAEAAVERKIEPTGRSAIGVDPAYQGKDNTSIAHVQGQCQMGLTRIHGADPMAVAGHVMEIIRDLDTAWISVDAIGIGAGVAARLKELQREGLIPDTTVIQAVIVSECARDTLQYANLKAEAWLNLADWIETASILNDRRLIGDLTAVRRGGHTSRGQMRLEPKEKTKERLGRSPDDGEALMLALIPPLPDEIVTYNTAEAVDEIDMFETVIRDI